MDAPNTAFGAGKCRCRSYSSDSDARKPCKLRHLPRAAVGLPARLSHRSLRRLPRQRTINSSVAQDYQAAGFTGPPLSFMAVDAGAGCGSSTNLCTNHDEIAPGMNPTSPYMMNWNGPLSGPREP